MKFILAIISLTLLINGIIADDNNKEQLLKKGEEIGKKAEDALKMLKSQNRNREARRLEKDIPLLEKSMQDYRNTKTTDDDDDKTKILEKELTLLIKKMSLEIQMAYSDEPDMHTLLVNRAKDMVKRGEKTLEFLKSKNRLEDGKTIENDVNGLKQIIDKVEQEDDLIKLNDLELQMIKAENKLSNDIFDIVNPH
ncbi:uncharacterized protein LOC113795943 [Dermatophagoides pteronyssinus]|uniref:Uncharacterized protein LOC113795943 n=1 Tax=Dermatophagoides pteronyssinus TaxID=6956 RepID=A0A6P6Y9K0_DERPT|nr:uncharacterized protein LOC113795943 [Dermatophagoides pteronyssinus]